MFILQCNFQLVYVSSRYVLVRCRRSEAETYHCAHQRVDCMDLPRALTRYRSQDPPLDPPGPYHWNIKPAGLHRSDVMTGCICSDTHPFHHHCSKSEKYQYTPWAVCQYATQEVGALSAVAQVRRQCKDVDRSFSACLCSLLQAATWS